MTQVQTYYDILGVSRTASAHEIRRAYLGLIKRYHPDSPDRAEQPDFARTLNRCYAVLKDPEKRSRYDAQLLAPRMLPVVHHGSRPRKRRSSPRHDWRAFLFIAIPSALAIAALAFAPDKRAEEFLLAATGWIAPQAPAPQAPTPVPHARDPAVQKLADAARTMAPDEAERASRACFAAALPRSEAAASDRCILFDVAFLYWQRPASVGAAFPIYFDDRVVEVRHREAVAAFGRASEGRLRVLRETGFQAVIHRIRGTQSAVEPSEAALAAAGSRELREGMADRLAASGVPDWNASALEPEHKPLDFR